jgi:predicted acyltransferase
MKTRIASIDIFRALTMLLMIFVNDLWTLHGIPGWLEHTEAHEDGMGLADVVFPAFLFIVGLSIPFALKARINKGESRFTVLIHIAKRSLALIVMGFFMVNENSMINGSEGFRTLWSILMILAFILIWNDYTDKKIGMVPVWLLQLSGVIILVILAILFKGGSPEDPRWMRPQWWGILGLIGWAYLVCATIYLLTMKRPWITVGAVLFFYILNVLEFVPAFPKLQLVVSASNHALVMSGILATVIYLQTRDHVTLSSSPVEGRSTFPLLLLIPATILLIFGFTSRPMWGISKILATPSWTAICASISFMFFALIYLIADVAKSTRWASIIMPAGRSTLTCYLVPGLVYPFLWPLEQMLPVTLLTGIAGIVKSVLFALLIIVLTGLLEKIHIKLKL